jgi:imidazolonepropionase-like amidohydrolase
MQIGLIALALFVAAGAARAQPAPSAPFQAFADVTVIRTYGEAPLQHQTVLVRAGRIVSVASSRTALPPNTIVLGHAGQILAPGLADMHVHIFNPDDGVLFLANGVTSVRNMNGRADTNALAQRIDAGLTPGPRIYSSGPIINAPSADWSAVAATPAEIRALVADEARSGYIAVKLYETLAPDVFAAGVAAARDNGLQVYAHVPLSMTLQQVLGLHIDSIEHLTGFDRALAPKAHSDWDEVRWANADVSRMAPLARQVVHSGVWNDATLVTLLDAPCAFANIAAAEAATEYRYATPRQRTLWRSQSQEASTQHELQGSCAMSQRAHQMRLAMLRALHAAGAPLLIGTDAPQPFVYPGFSLQRELALHLEAGFTRTDVLRIASRDAARFLHLRHEFGIIEAGARADLLLLDQNPETDLATLQHPAGVMAAGRWCDAAALAHLLDEAAARAQAPTHP